MDFLKFFTIKSKMKVWRTYMVHQKNCCIKAKRVKERLAVFQNPFPTFRFLEVVTICFTNAWIK